MYKIKCFKMYKKFYDLRFFRTTAFTFFLLAVNVVCLLAASVGDEPQGQQILTERLTSLVLQLGTIIIAAWCVGKLFEKMKLPTVLGEIVAGLIIGPYFLGQISVPGFPEGLFHVIQGFPISTELYGIATIASILLLFFAGIETDVDTFLSFSVVGSTVGIFGVIVSFMVGDLSGVFLSGPFLGQSLSFMHPIPLFLGVISTATSVGISARMLSEKRKMDSPEGITILSAAVIDDVLGIIALSIVIGIVKSGHISWTHIALIAARSIAIWLGFTIAGLVFYRQLANFLRLFRDRASISIVSFAFALFLAGIFEKSGMAMIIGAYVMGLSISKTDLAYIIQDNLAVLHRLLVPVFFCTMGMLVNFHEMTSAGIIMFGLIYTILAIVSKILGCGVPAYFMNFSLHGAATVGVGMVPRGEVALIIAGIGLTAGVIPHEIFSISIVMTFITTLLTPPVFSAMINSDKPVLKKDSPSKTEHREIRFPILNPETTDLVLSKIISTFESEGFYVRRLELDVTFFQIRKDETFISLRREYKELVFECRPRDESFIYTLLYEIISELEFAMKGLQSSVDRKILGKNIFSNTDPEGLQYSGYSKDIILPGTVDCMLKSSTKEGVIKELIEIIIREGGLHPTQRDKILSKILEREENMSTGMQHGIALPHAKVSVEHLVSAVGIHKEGVDFKSLDKQPSRIFIFTLIPKTNQEPYLQYIAAVSKFLSDIGNRERLLAVSSNEELYSIFSAGLNPPIKKNN